MSIKVAIYGIIISWGIELCFATLIRVRLIELCVSCWAINIPSICWFERVDSWCSHMLIVLFRHNV